MRNVADKMCEENKKKHFSRDFNEVMCKNMIELDNAIRWMDLESWMTKATNTHTNTFRIFNSYCFTTVASSRPSSLIRLMVIL
jgi:hypothetical protein